ncbi:MAG: hypothetical protein NC117_03140 [Pseudoflavonifractor sp.]|nr:hypothetical protein [Pseudoflavonifractor sp.]
MKYRFEGLESVVYKDAEAVRIAFSRKSGGVTVHGHLIIGTEDLSIRRLDYEISSIKDFTVEKTRRGLVHTNLADYDVSVEYDKDETGRYTISKAHQRTALSVRVGKDTVYTVCEVSLANTGKIGCMAGECPIESLFGM